MMGLLGTNYGMGLLITGKDAASPAFASASSNVKALAKTHGVSVKQMEKQIDGLAKSYDKSQKRMRTSFKVAGLGLAAALPAISFVKTAATFEQSMARVLAKTGATKEEFAELNKQARELGASTKFAASEVAGGMTFLSMAGFTPEEIAISIPAVLDVAASEGMTDLAQVADIMSNIQQGMGLEKSDFMEVADVLATISSESNVSLIQLGESFKMASAPAKLAGVTFKELGAMIGLLGDVGIQGTMAGTGVRAILNRMAAPTDAARKKFEDLGVSIENATGDVRGPVEILGALQEATEKMGSAERISTFKLLFETEALTAAAVLIEQEGTDTISSKAAAYDDATGNAAKQAEIMSDTVSGSFKKLESAQEGFRISMGTGLLPTTKLATDVLTGYTQTMEKLAETHPKLSQAVSVGMPALLMFGGTILGVAFKIKMMMTQMALVKLMGGETTGMFTRMGRAARWFGNTTVILRMRLFAMAAASRIAGLATGGATGLWGMMKRAVLGLRALSLASVAASLKLGIAAVATKLVTVATWLFSAALWANPITWIVVGVIALIAAIYLLATNWEWVTKVAKSAWAGMTTGLKWFWGLLKDFGRFFVKLWDKFGWVVKMSPAYLAIKGLVDMIKWALEAMGLLDGGTERRGGVLADRETGGPTVKPGAGLEPATLASGAVIFKPEAVGAGSPEVSADDIWDLKNVPEPGENAPKPGETTIINHNKFDISGTKLDERKLARKLATEQHEVERRGADGVRK